MLSTSGKVRYLGQSNRAGWQIADADFVARMGGSTRFISAQKQNHYSLLDRRADLEVIPAELAYGIGVLPNFLLGSGLLTGKYGKGTAPEGSRLTRSRSHLLGEVDFEQLGASASSPRPVNSVRLPSPFLGWPPSRPWPA